MLGVREAPYHEIHLENMLKLTRMGVIIAPPLPAFYNRPSSIADLVITLWRERSTYSACTTIVCRGGTA